MGFASYDDLISELTAGKTDQISWSKNYPGAAVGAAGRWSELFTGSGVPAGIAVSGAAGAFTSLNKDTAGALFPIANVSPDTRHLLSLAAQSAATTLAPATLVLCDILGYHSACVVTGTASTPGAVTLPRYATGAGVKVIVSVQTAEGAAQPALTFTYTDQDGNTGNVSPAALTAPANSSPIGILHQQGGALGSPYMPLVGGDTGVRAVTAYSIASGTTGTVTIWYVKPLIEIPIVGSQIVSQVNALTELPGMPQVLDGACLGFFVNMGGALAVGANLTGRLVTAHG